MSEATPSAAPPAASPAPTATPTASQPVAATPTPSAPPAVAPTPTPPSGEPPKERWEDILNNARTKTRREVEAEYKQKYGRYDAFEDDPWGAVQDWLKQASKHSILGPQVKQWASQFVTPESAAAEPQPDVPIVDAQGNITGHTYSAGKLKEWHQWNQAQARQALDERFRQLEERSQQTDEYVTMARSQAQASKTLDAFRKLPYFKDHEADISQALAEHEEWGDNLHAAYNYVLVTKILPTLSQAEQAKALSDLNAKAAGQTVQPGQPAPARPQFKSFKAAAEYYAAHPDEAAAAAHRG